MASRRVLSKRNSNSNFTFSPALTPQFTPQTREDYERYIAEHLRNHDSSTPSYSLNDLPRFQQPHNQHCRPPNDDLGLNSPASESDDDGIIPVLADVNDLLNALGRTHLPVLCPNREGTDIWFRHDKTGKITKQLLKMLKSDLPGPFATYRSLPIEVKNRWFRAFAQEFNWNPSITEYVRTNYNKQAAASFKANLCDWKVKWKEAGPENLPEWMKAKKKLFDGYIKMWTNEKTIKLAAQYSKNRGSQRGGLGVAKHNNGAKTYERGWDELIVELGTDPNMLHFMEQTHLDKKTRTISDMKTKKILEMATREMELVQSQRQS